MTTRKIEAGRLADTAVTPGSYGNSSAVPVITVDQQGRLTSASSTSVDGVSNFTYSSSNNTFTIATPAGSSYTASISAVEDMIVNGNTVLGSGATDVVQFNATVNSHIIPSANITYDLGSTTNRFRDLYLSGTSIYLGTQTLTANATHIDLGSASIATTGTTTGDADLGELTVSGNAAVTGTITGAAATITGTVSAANLYSSANATVVGTLTTADAVISGNLTVSGTTTYVNTSTLNIGDNIITLNADETGTPSQNAGFEVERGTSTNVSFVWDETNDRWSVGTEDLFFDDNAKAIFGAGSDLQIYHNPATGSYIEDAGAGNLILKGTSVVIDDSSGARMATFVDGGAVTLNHGTDASARLATTATGIDVTGNITFGDSHTIGNDGDDNLEIATSVGENLIFKSSGNVNTFLDTNEDQSTAAYQIYGDVTSPRSLLRVEETGDISFYEDTGTTAKLFWDASAERLGLGTSSPATSLHIQSSTPILRLTDSDTGASHELSGQSGAGNLNIKVDTGGTSGSPVFNISMQDSNKVSVLNNGNVGIGTTSPSTLLTLKRDSAGTGESDYALLAIDNGDANGFSQLRFQDDGAEIASIFSNSNEKYLIFRAGGATERMRIDSNGNVGIGDTTPSQKLDVNGNVRVDGAIYVADRIYHDGDTNTHIRFDSNDNISLNTSGGARLAVQSNGDVVFYDNTGASRQFRWDADRKSVRIGDADSIMDYRAPLEINGLAAGTGDREPVLAARSKVGASIMQLNVRGARWEIGSGGVLDTTPSVIINSNSSFELLNNGNNSNGHFKLGSNSNNSTKYISIRGQQYVSDTETEGYGIIGGVATSSDNRVRIGGGLSEENAATQIEFITAGSTTTRGGTERMRIDSSGNVGIGTTSPDGPLHVVGADDGITISSASANRPHLRLISGSTETLRLSVNGTYGAIGDGSDSNRYMAFYAGNVGINTTVPTKKLEVNGAVVAATQTTTKSGTPAPNFDDYQNFVWTLTGNITLLNPTTEKTGQTGFFIFIHSGAGRTVSLGTDYETAGGAGLTLSTTSGAADIVPYAVLSTGRILLGTPQLAFA